MERYLRISESLNFRSDNMNLALLLSGGAGIRLGTDIPKQYLEVCGRPVIAYGIERLSEHPLIDAFWIAANDQWHELIHVWVEKMDMGAKFRGFTPPGKNRQLSIYYGLEEIRQYANEKDYVLIHDAARPLLTQQLVTECVHAAKGHDGALPVLPMKDTVYRSKDGKYISALLDREEIFAGQAPEIFLIEKYYQANRLLLPKKITQIRGASEPAVLAGMDIVMIAGDERNFKITTRSDLERFRKIQFDVL